MKIDFIKKVAARALWTFCESMLGCIVAGAPVEQTDWRMALSVSMTAVIASVLKSIAVGLPEAEDSDEE